MKKYFIIVLVLFFSNGGFSQPSVRFKRLYDLPPHITSESHGVITTDFGYIISGITIDTSGGGSYSRLTIMAVDTLGDSLWVKNYGSTPNFQYTHHYSPRWMIKKGNNLYLTCPVLKPGYIWTSVLIKFNMSGDTIWQKEYSSTDPFLILDGINSTPDSGFITSGLIADTTSESLLLLKMDSLGNEQWRKKINTNIFSITGQQVIYDTITNKYIIVGTHNPSPTSESKSIVIITDSLGNKLNQFSFNSINGGGLNDIIQSSDNNFIACGIDYTGLMIGSWQKMVSQIVKFDINGNIIWQKRFGVPSIINYFSSIIELPSSELILGGEYDTIYNYGLGLNTDFKIQKTTALGDSIWSRQISLQGMDHQDSFRGLDTTNDGGYVLTGFFPVGPSPQKFCLVKLDSYGCDSLGCQFVGIQETEVNNNELNIYPNPSDGVVTLEFKIKTTKDILIEIKNIYGQLIYLESCKSSSNIQSRNIDLSMFAKGVYLIQLRSEDKISSKKISIE